MNDIRHQHLSVVQAASALEAVAAAANALARGSELPSLLQFQGMVQNQVAANSSNLVAAGGHHSASGGSIGHPAALNQGDGGLSELQRRLDTVPYVDAQHVARSLEDSILQGSALLSSTFLSDMSASDGRLRDALSYSAGTPISRTNHSEEPVRHGDKIYPSWPASSSSSSSIVYLNPHNQRLVSSAKAPTNQRISSTSSSLLPAAKQVDNIPLEDSPEMRGHLRNLNVTVAALGLGLAISNDEEEEDGHTIRSYGAKVSDCEMKRQDTLRHADQQNSLVTLAARSFYRRTSRVLKSNDVVASTKKRARSQQMSSLGDAVTAGYAGGDQKENEPGSEPGETKTGWRTRRARRRRGGGGGGGGDGRATRGEGEKRFEGIDDVASSSSDASPSSHLIRKIFSAQFHDLCHRDPVTAADVLSEFSDRMMEHLNVPRHRYLRPIGQALSKSGLGISPWCSQTLGVTSAHAAAIATHPRMNTGGYV